jgi:hypothetical protein
MEAAPQAKQMSHVLCCGGHVHQPSSCRLRRSVPRHMRRFGAVTARILHALTGTSRCVLADAAHAPVDALHLLSWSD